MNLTFRLSGDPPGSTVPSINILDHVRSSNEALARLEEKMSAVQRCNKGIMAHVAPPQRVVWKRDVMAAVGVSCYPEVAGRSDASPSCLSDSQPVCPTAEFRRLNQLQHRVN